MFRRQHAIVVSLCLLPIGLLAAGCGEDEKATPQVIFEGRLELGGAGNSCKDVGPLFNVGDFGNPAADEKVPSKPIKDGDAFEQGSVGVSCEVLPAGGDEFNVRRGITPLRRLLAAGVPVALATNNIRNPFTPIGTADLADLTFLTAVAGHMGTPREMRMLLDTITVHPARMLRLPEYGLAPGCRADLLVWDCAVRAALRIPVDGRAGVHCRQLAVDLLGTPVDCPEEPRRMVGLHVAALLGQVLVPVADALRVVA